MRRGLDEGRVGILVTPGSPDQLADALLGLLDSPAHCTRLASRLRRRVHEVYSPARFGKQVCQIYDEVVRSARKH